MREKTLILKILLIANTLCVLFAVIATGRTQILIRQAEKVKREYLTLIRDKKARWPGEGAFGIINNSKKLIWLSKGKKDNTLTDCIFIQPHMSYCAMVENLEKFTIINVEKEDWMNE